MCHRCGNNYCSCGNPNYSFNWMSTENYPCNPCSVTNVCKKKIPAKCTIYNGPALSFLELPTGTDIEVILSSIDSALQSISEAQELKNINILTVLNDINDRLNVIEGNTHPPYQI